MYALLSDLHLHKWSAFSHTNEDGINSRLQIIIDEVWRAAYELKKHGGHKLLLGGDIFHVRGKISPTVLNPVLDCFEKLINEGYEILAISGNHDLESNNAETLSSSISALSKVGVQVFNEPRLHDQGDERVAFIPYIDDIEQLKTAILEVFISAACEENPTDLIIHAPVDGVIKGLPDHGLDPEWLGKVGFRRVFAGHYHNHVEFGNGVYSIGATTHQTWGDTDSKAGFLLVGDDVTYRASNAPRFYTLDEDTDQEDVPLLVDGNYVRVTMEVEKESDVSAMRDFLTESGALGVTINKLKKSASVSRTGATVSSGASVESSVGEFIKAAKYDNQKELVKLCADILSEVEEV
ncbi:MAG: metallophosphoesterase [Piscirickettsiaceae bacterium]|nr:metallophosphoesterase [Piscirickettsiaceae bacterium]